MSGMRAVITRVLLSLDHLRAASYFTNCDERIGPTHVGPALAEAPGGQQRK